MCATEESTKSTSSPTKINPKFHTENYATHSAS